MRKIITDKLMSAARLPEGKRQDFIRDSKLKGFGARITRGINSFIYETKATGRVTLGAWPAMSTQEARRAAYELSQASAAGVMVKKTRKTVEALCGYFMEVRGAKLSKQTLKTYRGQLRVIVEQLGARRFEDLTKTEIRALHRSFGDRTYMANRTVQLLRAVGNVALEDELIRVNPVVRFKGRDFHREEMRNDYMEPAELQRLFVALPKTGAGDAIRLLALTGARRGEVLGMTWTQLEGNRWVKPAAMTKQRREHVVFLNDAARDVITRQPRLGPHVFTNNGQPIADLRWPFARALKAAGLPHRRLHDLRHSFASLLASEGVSLHIVGKLLGHSNPGTTARYAGLYGSALEEAAEKANVVKLFATARDGA